MRKRAASSKDEVAAPANASVRPRTMRGGLLTKLNLLTVGLIVATAVAVSALLVAQQIDAEQARLKTQGQTIVSMLSDLSEYAVYTADVSALERLLQSLEADREIAYVAVHDDQGRLIASRGYGDAAVPPAPAVELHPGAIESSVRSVRGRRYLELVSPIADAKSGPVAALAEPPTGGAPIGYVRLGMSYERNQAQLRANILGALSVVATLMIIAILATLLLTRRLLSPIRDLVRAAKAIGAGDFGVRVTPTSKDEIGLLTHAFNQMTQRLSKSQSEVTGYQRTLEEKVVQRTKELEIAIAQAYKLAQHDILTGLPNRAGTASSQKSIGPRLWTTWPVRSPDIEYGPTSGVCDVNTS